MAQVPPAIVKIPTKTPQLVPDRIAKPPVAGSSARGKNASGTSRSTVFASGSGRAARRGSGEVIELECGVTVYPARSEGGRWRAVWHEAGERRQCEAATADGVFLWAYWPVAAAFGMRVTAADRGAVLDVWQRPSRARAGEVEPQIWAQRPLRFTSAPAPAAGLQFSEHLWPASLELLRIAAGPGRARRATAGGKVTVLLVRFSASEWGPLPPVAAVPPSDPLDLRLRCAVSVLPSGSTAAEVHELRCVPPDGPSGAQFPWQQFPALAAEAATWIERKAKELDGHTLLLGTLLPQEAGLGLGILAGQESRRASWPGNLWPIVRDARDGTLVVPSLNLGATALDPARPTGGA